MTLETAMLTRWLPWVALVHLVAFALLWRAVGRPPLRVALPALAVIIAAAATTATLASRADPDLRLDTAIAYMATVSLATAALLWLLWSRCGSLSPRGCALLLGTVLLAFYLGVLPYVRTVQPTASDEPHYLIITQSIVLDGDMDLANDYAGERYREFYDDRLPDVHGIGVGTHIYTIRDLGLPLMSVPFFAVAGRTGVLVLVCIVGAYLAGMLLVLLRVLGLSPRTAVLATGAAGMLHPLATYTTQVSPELFCAALFATALYALRRGRDTSIRGFAAASACLGLIGIFSTRSWFIALGVGLCIAYFALRPRAPLSAGGRVARIAVAGVPFLLLLLATSYGNCLMFPYGDGSGRCYFMPSAGYYLLRDQQQVLSYAPQSGVTGLLFDRTFGLLSHTPLYLLAFVGVPSLIRALRTGRGPLLAPLLAGSLVLILYIGSIAYWWADGAPPSRYLVAAMPLWVIGLGFGLDRLRGLRWSWLLVVALLIPSAVVSFIFMITPAERYDLALDVIRTGYPGRLWVEVATWFHWNAGLLFPSIPRADSSALYLSLVWWAIALGLVVLGIRRRRTAPAD